MVIVIFALIPLILSVGLAPVMFLDVNADYIDKFSLPYVLDPLTDSQIKTCESIHKDFVSLSDFDFYTRYQTNNFAGNCVMLYEDPLWSYEDTDRYEKLSERSTELTQEQETKLKQSRGNFYINPKSLTELQIPGTFLFKFEGCTGDQTINARDISVVSDKENILLTKFVGEEREILPGVCNQLEMQIRADDPSSIKVVVSSLDIEIPAKLDPSTKEIEPIEDDLLNDSSAKNIHHIPILEKCAPGFVSLGDICVLNDRCGPGVYPGKVCVMDGEKQPYLAPKHQSKSGIPASQTICAEGLELIFKENTSVYTPACVKSTSVEKLLQRGWTDQLPPIACTLEYDPQCGIDGITYANKCMIKVEGISISYGGQCNMATSTPDVSINEIRQIAEDAYIYGYPMILMDLTAKKMSNVPEAGAQTAPVNQFAHFQEFPTPDFTDVVKPNADTLYSLAWLNLSDEPLVLHVPDADDRYYLMPMLDAYSNVFESPGKRTTGTEANDFAIVGPFWDGKLPDGVTKIQSPTELVWILGRTQANGVDDFDAVNEIQKQYTLTPLSSFGKSYQPPQTVGVDSSIDMETPPVTKIEQANADVFFDRMAILMKANPPASDDTDMVAKFAKIGIIPGEKFSSSDLDPKIVEAIELGVKDGLEKIKSNIANVGTNENGWQKAVNLGSYGTNYLLRASVAFMGLGANLPEDAIYPMTYVDSNGDTLNGNNKYVIHFPKDQTPPVNAFWSITMYNVAEFFVENPIDLYAIGDRNELKYNEDGSLDIYIQHKAPEEHESNWLPAPDDDFNLTMRMYWPNQEIMDGTWNIPSVQKVK